MDSRGALARSGDGPPEPARRTIDHLCLQLEPFDAVAIHAHLAASGVTPELPQNRYGAAGEGPSIYFSDPEGNMVELKGRGD